MSNPKDRKADIQKKLIKRGAIAVDDSEKPTRSRKISNTSNSQQKTKNRKTEDPNMSEEELET